MGGINKGLRMITTLFGRGTLGHIFVAPLQGTGVAVIVNDLGGIMKVMFGGRAGHVLPI